MLKYNIKTSLALVLKSEVPHSVKEMYWGGINAPAKFRLTSDFICCIEVLNNQCN
jgi:hypothetical protein